MNNQDESGYQKDEAFNRAAKRVLDRRKENEEQAERFMIRMNEKLREMAAFCNFRCEVGEELEQHYDTTKHGKI